MDCCRCTGAALSLPYQWDPNTPAWSSVSQFGHSPKKQGAKIVAIAGSVDEQALGPHGQKVGGLRPGVMTSCFKRARASGVRKPAGQQSPLRARSVTAGATEYRVLVAPRAVAHGHHRAAHRIPADPGETGHISMRSSSTFGAMLARHDIGPAGGRRKRPPQTP